MPIYSYACPACEHSFDELVPMAEREHHDCPNCGARANQRVTPVRLDTLSSGWDSGLPTTADRWDRIRAQQKAKEEKAFRDHGDYGKSPGS